MSPLQEERRGTSSRKGVGTSGHVPRPMLMCPAYFSASTKMWPDRSADVPSEGMPALTAALDRFLSSLSVESTSWFFIAQS